MMADTLTIIPGPWARDLALLCPACGAYMGRIVWVQGTCEGLVFRCRKCLSAYHWREFPESAAEFVNVPELERQWNMPPIKKKAGG